MKKRLFIGTKVKLLGLEKVKEEVTSLQITGKWVEEENLHFTFRFLGEFEEEKIPSLATLLQGKLKSCKPFNVKFKGLGVFKRNGIPRVLFVKVFSEEIKEVKKKIDQALLPFGYPLEENFTPHVTLLRIKRFKRKAKFNSFMLKMEEFIFGEEKERKITLFESKLTEKGPIYKVVKEFNLG